MRIKNWQRFQHYQSGKRSVGTPEWIKLYHKLLDDPEWFCLSDGASRLLVECWMIASESSGELPPLKTIAFRLRKKIEEIESLISELDHWLEADASTVLAECYHPASAEENRREEKRVEKKYRFSGKIIRVDEKLYDSWKTNYPHVDLAANLQSLDDWMSCQPPEKHSNWVFMVSGALRKRNDEAKAKKPVPLSSSTAWQDEKAAFMEKHGVNAWYEHVSKRSKARKDALVCGDDKGTEGSIGPATVKAAGI